MELIRYPGGVLTIQGKDFRKEREKTLLEKTKQGFQKVEGGYKKVVEGTSKAIKGGSFAPVKAKPTNPGVILSKEQGVMNELFNGQRTFGTGQNLPKINHTLTSGTGLIKHDDMYERRTAKMFGF